MGAKPPDREPDVTIGARVKAKRLRFEEEPETEVRLRGARTAKHSERDNLPDEVEAGKTYRDVEVRWAAGAWAAEADEGEREADESES